MKRSRGKGKKPLEDEGNKTDRPQVLHETADEDDGTDVEVDLDDPPSIQLHSRVPDAYNVLRDILAERRGNWFSGIYRNFRRNNRRGVRWTLNTVVGIFAGGAVLAVTGDPTAAAAAFAAGMGVPTVASTTHIRKSRLDDQRRDYPDLPEFRDDWAVACYELMRMLNGYNLRRHAIHRLRSLADEIDDEQRAEALTATADAMSELLWDWRQELVEVAELLAKYETGDISSVLTPPQTHAIIRLLNPFKDGLYDWLTLDPEIIPPGHEQELLDRDLREIACHQDIIDAIDPYTEEVIRRRMQLQQEADEEEERKKAAAERKSPKKKDDSDD